MQVVIDIPTKVYGTLKYFESALDGFEPSDIKGVLIMSILKGKVLPEGHGRLIDADELRSNAIKHKYSNNFCEEHNIDWSINLGMLNILIADAPTIIEADKE